MNLRFAYSVLFTPTIAQKKAYIKEKGIPNPADVFTVYRPHDLTWISASSVDIDFPLTIIPENVVPCGPIAVSTAPASQQDPELATWIARAPTVLINLGSHVDFDRVGALEMAGAINILLTNHTDIQVLWKVNERKDLAGVIEKFADELTDQLSEAISSSRVRLEKWLSIDPSAMFHTGNIVAVVNHGGANSYGEAVL
jgi:hypothetical protein